MKHFISLFSLLILVNSFAQPQGDLTIYSNTGDQFYVVLNGIRQNDRPETNVKITGLTNNWYNCKILSVNNNFEIEKNVVVKFDTLVTYRIKEKRGKYKLRFYSQTSLGTATTQTEQSVVNYHTTENPIDNSTTNQSSSSSNNGSQTTTTTTTTSTTSTSSNSNTNTNGESVNVNINVNENGADMNVNASGSQNGQVTTTTSTTTTTTTSDDGTTHYEETTVNSGTSDDGTTYYEETTTTTSTSSNVATDASSNSNSCYTSDGEVDQLVKQIKDESFSDDQQRIANMAAQNKCMNTEQIKRVASVFSFSENKMNFVKKAYDNCPDKENYYKVMDVFTFSTDKEELEKFINSK